MRRQRNDGVLRNELEVLLVLEGRPDPEAMFSIIYIIETLSE